MLECELAAAGASLTGYVLNYVVCVDINKSTQDLVHQRQSGNCMSFEERWPLEQGEQLRYHAQLASVITSYKLGGASLNHLKFVNTDLHTWVPYRRRTVKFGPHKSYICCFLDIFSATVQVSTQ